ncbi:MAG: hypothetical protein D6679_10115 [Candidatus Hydrogenedentota bacterium]|nr:MAG: hypothetical protein D6679_10115 [Candidatus Hydrogenedentota bacterium]
MGSLWFTEGLGIFLFFVFVELVVERLWPQITYSYQNELIRKGRYNLFAPDEVVGYRLKPSLKNHSVYAFDHWMKPVPFLVSTDEDGYRISRLDGREEPVYALVIGDSKVFGFGVDNDRTIPSVLSALLDKKVKNCGLPGAGLGEHYFTLKRALERYPEARYVVLYVNLSTDTSEMEEVAWDVEREEFPARIEREHFVTEEGFLKQKNPPFVYRIPVIRNFHSAILLFTFFLTIKSLVISGGDRLFRKGPTRILDEKRTKIQRCVAKYAEVLREWRGKAIFVWGMALPYYDGRKWYDRFDGWRKEMEEMIRGEEIDAAFVNLLPLIREKSARRSLYVEASHYSSRGCEFVAKRIFEVMRRNAGENLRQGSGVEEGEERSGTAGTSKEVRRSLVELLQA